MTIAGSNLTTNSSPSTAATYNTASISPGANRLILAFISGGDSASTTAPTYSLSGNGLTWVSVRRHVRSGTTESIQVFRAMGPSPSAGAVTIASDVATLNSCLWSISEYTGINTNGTNGSAAVGNSADNDATSANGLTVTLPAFGSVNNGAYGGFVGQAGTTYNVTPGSGFTEIAENTLDLGGAYYVVIQSQWRADNDTSVDASASGAVTLDEINGIAVEIVAASLVYMQPFNKSRHRPRNFRVIP